MDDKKQPPSVGSAGMPPLLFSSPQYSLRSIRARSVLQVIVFLFFLQPSLPRHLFPRFFLSLPRLAMILFFHFLLFPSFPTNLRPFFFFLGPEVSTLLSHLGFLFSLSRSAPVSYFSFILFYSFTLRFLCFHVLLFFPCFPCRFPPLFASFLHSRAFLLI